MKSERRHELQSNSLAGALSNAPSFMRMHGSKVLLAIIIVLLVAILLNQRSRRSRETLESGWANIAGARSAISQMSYLAARRGEAPATLAKARNQLIDSATAALASVVGADNRQLAAEAYLVRGDLNWTLANLPEIPAAATQPSLRLASSPKEYLDKAEESYQRVVRNEEASSLTATNAKFGLVAVAENKGEWESARKQLEAIKSDPKTLEVYQTLATQQLEHIDEISKPIYVVPATQPTTSPAKK